MELLFKEWFLNEMKGTYGKTGLYASLPILPPQSFMVIPDALVYMSQDSRMSKNWDWMLNKLPGKPPSKLNLGDDKPWSIVHLRGKPSHNNTGNYAMTFGDKGIFDISHLKS